MSATIRGSELWSEVNAKDAKGWVDQFHNSQKTTWRYRWISEKIFRNIYRNAKAGKNFYNINLNGWFIKLSDYELKVLKETLNNKGFEYTISGDSEFHINFTVTW